MQGFAQGVARLCIGCNAPLSMNGRDWWRDGGTRNTMQTHSHANAPMVKGNLVENLETRIENRVAKVERRLTRAASHNNKPPITTAWPSGLGTCYAQAYCSEEWSVELPCYIRQRELHVN